jgi:hypothetical protein
MRALTGKNWSEGGKKRAVGIIFLLYSLTFNEWSSTPDDRMSDFQKQAFPKWTCQYQLLKASRSLHADITMANWTARESGPCIHQGPCSTPTWTSSNTTLPVWPLFRAAFRAWITGHLNLFGILNHMMLRRVLVIESLDRRCWENEYINPWGSPRDFLSSRSSQAIRQYNRGTDSSFQII